MANVWQTNINFLTKDWLEQNHEIKDQNDQHQTDWNQINHYQMDQYQTDEEKNCSRIMLIVI